MEKLEIFKKLKETGKKKFKLDELSVVDNKTCSIKILDYASGELVREYIFEDMYQYHTNEEDTNQENINEEQINENIITNTNNSQISFFIVIISKIKKKNRILLILVLTGFL